MYRYRTLEGFFKKANRQFPVLMITGPRQVGKTTFLKHISEKKRMYVSLDDPNICLLAKQDPHLFLQRYTAPVLIDEIQYAPELLPVIKSIVDQEKKPGMVWLTGSQQFHLMRGVSESLAGRVGIINLLGFSFRELCSKTNALPFELKRSKLVGIKDDATVFSLKKTYDLIWRGSFPDIALNKAKDWELFYSSYLQTYLQRDVRALTQVGNEMSFIRFLRAAAARTGQLLNISDMARDADVSSVTAKNWLSILESSGIVYLLEPYFNNISKRFIKAPKLYFIDTGLCSYLTQWSSPQTLEAGAMSGAIFETAVVIEIIKSFWHAGRRAPIYFYRDKDSKEIDLLIIEDDVIYPVEIKKTMSPDKSAVRHFSVLNKLKKKIGRGVVICLTPDILPITENIDALSVGLI